MEEYREKKKNNLEVEVDMDYDPRTIKRGDSADSSARRNIRENMI